jgi:hypothetical protein
MLSSFFCSKQISQLSKHKNLINVVLCCSIRNFNSSFQDYGEIKVVECLSLNKAIAMLFLNYGHTEARGTETFNPKTRAVNIQKEAFYLDISVRTRSSLLGIKAILTHIFACLTVRKFEARDK